MFLNRLGVRMANWIRRGVVHGAIYRLRILPSSLPFSALCSTVLNVSHQQSMQPSRDQTGLTPEACILSDTALAMLMT